MLITACLFVCLVCWVPHQFISTGTSLPCHRDYQKESQWIQVLPQVKSSLTTGLKYKLGTTAQCTIANEMSSSKEGCSCVCVHFLQATIHMSPTSGNSSPWFTWFNKPMSDRILVFPSLLVAPNTKKPISHFESLSIRENCSGRPHCFILKDGLL